MVLGKDHRQSRFVQREVGGNILFTFNDPQAERFAGIHQMIYVTQLLVNFVHNVPGISGNNPVNQSIAENAAVCYPSFKFIAQIPQVNILVDAFFQIVAFMLDQLAGDNDKPLIRRSLKLFKTAVEEFGPR